MTGKRLRFAVDASVGIKLFVEEQLSERALAIFSHLAADPPAELYIPDLFYIECATILLKYTRRFGRSLEDSQADLDDLGRLALRSTSTADLMEKALRLASERELSAYDAWYVALAEKLEIPLSTADQPLARKIETAIYLGDLDVQPFVE